jgi:hypothetical protein
MKFLFVQEKRFNVIYRELGGVLGEAAVSLATITRWCQRFKDGNFSLGDEFKSHRPRRDIGEVISQFLSKEAFISALILARGLATKPAHNQRDSHTQSGNAKVHTNSDAPKPQCSQ